MKSYAQLSNPELQQRLDQALADLRREGQLESEPAHLLHELSVYQIELEMQNRELREAEAGLEEARDRYIDLFDLAPIGYVTLDGKGIATRINFTAAEMLRSTPQAAVGRPLAMFIAPEQAHRFIQYLARVMANQERVVEEFQLRLGNAGPATDVRVDGLRVRGTECRIALIDISAQKRAEAQAREQRDALLHAARLATLGELASGIAHEISQPLGAIGSYANALGNMVRSGSGADPQIEPTIDKMLAQVERAGAILHRVRAFARRQRVERTPEDILDVIREVRALMEPALEKNQVKVRIDRHDVLLKPALDRVQIIQVFVNLINNAMEAMSDNDPENREIVIEIAMPDRDWMDVAVKDQGHALPLGDYDKLFMPFFTTRRDGLGLGLSLSHSIVEAHGGRMWAHPNTPRGMVFRFTLPIYDKNHDKEH